MKKYAILIGNSQFPEESDKAKLPDLACPVQDVDGLSKVLASERGKFDVSPLKNEPSYKILRELQRKLKQATSDDLFLLYYSGHGKPNKSNILHLTTFDTVVAELATSSISMNRIYEILSEAKCRKIVIILDCCYSGAAGQGFKGAVDDQLQQLNNARGTYLVTASTELQVAHESAEEGLSLFTKHLIAGLETGEADKDGDGWVSMNELYDYVQGKVVDENRKQQPTKYVKDERGDLIIAESGRDSRKERSEKLEGYFYDLVKEKKIAGDILIEVLRIIETPVKALSAIDKEKDALIDRVHADNNTLNFVRKWDNLNNKKAGFKLISIKTISVFLLIGLLIITIWYYWQDFQYKKTDVVDTAGHTYKPCKFGGRVGKLIVKNNSLYAIDVNLYHPNTARLFVTKRIEGQASIDYTQDYPGYGFGDDWGIQLGDSEVKCIGKVSKWENDVFYTSSSTFY